MEYALKGVKNPMGVTEYHLTKKLPKKLKGTLPDQSELKQKIMKEMGGG